MTNEPPSPSPHSYPPGMFRSFVWQALHSVLPPSEEMIRCFQPFQPPSPLFNWSFNRVYLHLWLDVGSEQQTRRFQLQKGVSLGLQKISLTYFIPFSAQNEVSWAKKKSQIIAKQSNLGFHTLLPTLLWMEAELHSSRPRQRIFKWLRPMRSLRRCPF